MSEYLRDVGDLPVLAQVKPGDIAALLPQHAPRTGEPLEAILADIDRLILPGITHWNHPAFFAYFGITGSGPGIVGELIAAALNVNAMLWRTSPAATELEERTLELGGRAAGAAGRLVRRDHRHRIVVDVLRAGRGPGRQPGSTSGSGAWPAGTTCRCCGCTPRRRRIPRWEKACIALGLGRQGLRAIEVDEALRMRADLLELAIEEDIAAGVRPIAVVPSVGTTSTTSVDPVPEVVEIARRHRLWVHVDAAYGGAAGLVESHRHLLAGCELADSLVVNPHKWMLTPVDCSLLYTARPEVLRQPSRWCRSTSPPARPAWST